MSKIIAPAKILAFGFIAFLFSCQPKTGHPKDSHTKTDTIAQKIISKPPSLVGIDTTKTLKENTLLAYIPTAETIKPNPKNGVPFNQLNYDKIIAYDFEGDEKDFPDIIDAKGKFVPVIWAQKALTQQQADKTLSALTKNSSYGEPTAFCFEPKFALVFYKDNKPIHQVNICLDCNYLLGDIYIPASAHTEVYEGTGEHVPKGFSYAGRAAIINLCKELKFRYGNEKNKER